MDFYMICFLDYKMINFEIGKHIYLFLFSLFFFLASLLILVVRIKNLKIEQMKANYVHMFGFGIAKRMENK